MNIEFNLSDFDYLLPEDKIALRQLPDRAQSKLLVCDINNQKITHSYFRNIASFLKKSDLLIINNSKVIPARLMMQKPSGKKCEILLLEQDDNFQNNYSSSRSSTAQWKCLIGGKKIRVGDKFIPIQKNNEFFFEAEIITKNLNEAIVEFNYKPEDLSFGQILEFFGSMPLPPYIKRETEDSDKTSYQTVYAKTDGSVAAPTAGLHFTEEILNELNQKGIQITEITLHVGAGTFLPIKNDDPKSHKMHSERFSISLNTIKLIRNQIQNNSGRIIPVGTTAVRTLESIYWLGAKIVSSKKQIKHIEIEQWCWFELDKLNIPVIESLDSIINWAQSHKLEEIVGKTSLFIVPGYNFKIIDSMITNFHLPKTTLILLVSAFTGKNLWKAIYNEALDNNYRFLSYGDTSLLMK